MTLFVIVIAFLSALSSCFLGWMLRGTFEDERIANSWQAGFDTGKDYAKSEEHTRKFPPFPPDKRGTFPVLSSAHTQALFPARLREPFTDNDPRAKREPARNPRAFG